VRLVRGRALRLRLERAGEPETHVLVARPRRGQARLTRPVRVRRAGTVSVRLTERGRRYLRRHRRLVVTSLSSGESVELAVRRG
jgi:hypothetical protein